MYLISTGTCSVYSRGNELTQIRNAALSIFLDEDIFALQIPMRNGWLPLSPEYLDVQMCKTAGYGQDDAQAADGVQRGELQVVIQRPHFVVVGD